MTRIEERTELAKQMLIAALVGGIGEIDSKELVDSANRMMETLYGDDWKEGEKDEEGNKVAGYAVIFQGKHFDGEEFCKVSDVGTVYKTREDAEKNNPCHWPIARIIWEERK